MSVFKEVDSTAAQKKKRNARGSKRKLLKQITNHVHFSKQKKSKNHIKCKKMKYHIKNPKSHKKGKKSRTSFQSNLPL